MSNYMTPLWLKIVAGIVVVILIWWRVSRKWNKASAYSDAMAGEVREQKQWFEKAKNDLRVQQFIKHMAAKLPIAEGNIGGSENYIVRYVSFNSKGKQVSPDDSSAEFISLYVEGKDRLIISKNLVTGEVFEQKASKMSYNLSLPEWLKNNW